MIVLDGVEMLDVREAARLALRTPETVRRWVWIGRISARKEGNRLLIARGELLAAIETGRSGSRHQRRPELSLSEWLREARKSQASSTPGASARDLVFAERAARSGLHARR